MHAEGTSPPVIIELNQPERPEDCQKVDENGEAIIAEAVLNDCKFCLNICGFYMYWGVLLCFVCFPLTCIYCSRKAAASWKLYLTPASIRYTEIGISSCCYRDKFIPLSDIEDVVLQENILVYDGSAASQGYTVKLEMKNIGKYLSWYQGACCNRYLGFNYVENAAGKCLQTQCQSCCA